MYNVQVIHNEQVNLKIEFSDLNFEISCQIIIRIK